VVAAKTTPQASQLAAFFYGRLRRIASKLAPTVDLQ
jgi:hypothetical protein